ALHDALPISDPEHQSAIGDPRNELLEGIIAESEDETLMDRYLSGEEIETEVIIEDLEKAVARGSFHPVVPVCAETRVGLDALLEVLARGFPSPLEHELPPVTNLGGDPREPLRTDPDGPLVAEVVKTTVDPYVGRVSLVRVFSGTLKPETAVHVSGHGMEGRGHRRQDPLGRGRAGQEPGAAGRRGPDAAPGTQPGDPPARAVVHGRGARRRGTRPAARRRRRTEYRTGARRAAGDLRQRRQG